MPDSLTLLLLICIFAVALYSLHKIRRVHLLLYQLRDQFQRESNELFHQTEALQGLYADLDLRKSLPPTRGWAASPDFLLELARHAMEGKPQTVVECSSGVSTLVLARCMQLNGGGKVYSLEHDPAYAHITRMNLARHNLSEWATVLDAPLYPHQLRNETWSWYSENVLPQDCSIDMLAIDGPPMTTRPLARYPAGPILFPRLAENAAVFLDDAARADEKKILDLWRTEFPELRQSIHPCEKGCAILQTCPAADRAPN